MFRRTSTLFRCVDQLERVALYGADEEASEELGGGKNKPVAYHSPQQQEEEDKLSRAGHILSSLTDHMVRNMCGEQVYSSGLTYYMAGRMSDRRFSDNTISAKVNAKKKGLFSRGPEILEPTLTFERSKKNSDGQRISIYGRCGCSQSHDLCPHAAALMIAWVRKPRAFEENEEEDKEEKKEGTNNKLLFDRERERVMRSLKEVVNSIQQTASSRSDDLEVLQKVYSKLRLWTSHVKEAEGHHDGGNLTLPGVENDSPHPKSGVFISEFSATINSVSFAIMSAIERKYPGVGATDLYNGATVSTFARVLESFVENASYGVGRKEKQEESVAEETSSTLVTPPMAKGGKTASRSWDGLIDELAGR